MKQKDEFQGSLGYIETHPVLKTTRQHSFGLVSCFKQSVLFVATYSGGLGRWVLVSRTCGSIKKEVSKLVIKTHRAPSCVRGRPSACEVTEGQTQ